MTRPTLPPDVQIETRDTEAEAQLERREVSRRASVSKVQATDDGRFYFTWRAPRTEPVKLRLGPDQPRQYSTGR